MPLIDVIADDVIEMSIEHSTIGKPMVRIWFLYVDENGIPVDGATYNESVYHVPYGSPLDTVAHRIAQTLEDRSFVILPSLEWMNHYLRHPDYTASDSRKIRMAVRKAKSKE